MVDSVLLDEVLLGLGHDDRCSGTQFIRDGVRLYSPRIQLTKDLYPKIARLGNTTWCAAERCMRHSIAKAWRRGSADFQRRLFGFSVDTHKAAPAVGEYIARLYRVCARKGDCSEN